MGAFFGDHVRHWNFLAADIGGKPRKLSLIELLRLLEKRLVFGLLSCFLLRGFMLGRQNVSPASIDPYRLKPGLAGLIRGKVFDRRMSNIWQV